MSDNLNVPGDPHRQRHSGFAGHSGWLRDYGKHYHIDQSIVTEREYQTFRLICEKIAHLEKTINGLNGSMTNLTGVVLGGVTVQSQLPIASSSFAVGKYLPKRRSPETNDLAVGHVYYFFFFETF